MANRNSKGQFVKGASGNPAGVAKPLQVVNEAGQEVEITDLYRNNAGPVFAALYSIIMDKKAPASARVSAIKEYNLRALGQAARIVDTPDNYEEDAIDVSMLPNHVLQALSEAAKEGSKGDE